MIIQDLKIKRNIKKITGCKKPIKRKLFGKNYWTPCMKCENCKKNIKEYREYKAKKEAEETD